MNKSIAIITMAGEGKRFKEAGYFTYKPFLRINDKTLLDGVIKHYLDLDAIYIITTEKILKRNSEEFYKLPKKCSLITINEHKNGPAYSIFLAKGKLPENAHAFLAYCDVWWDHRDLLIHEIAKNSNPAILVHSGFHPHLVEDNFSAFCKPDKQNRSQLFEIREKASFTDNWMEEQVSIGVFFFPKVKLLMKYVERLIKNKNLAAGEYYPSLIFNYLLEDNHKVDLIEVESYAHVGVPAQYEDIVSWANYQAKKNNFSAPEVYETEYCMLLGGSGSRMRSVEKLPKHLMRISDKSMYEIVIEMFGLKKISVVTYDKTFLPKIVNSYVERIPLTMNSNSHLETLLFASNNFKTDKSIFFLSCDCFGIFDYDYFNKLIFSENPPDGVIFSAKKTLLQTKLKGQHTIIKGDDVGSLKGIDIKGRDNLIGDIMAGFFWFKSIDIILDMTYLVENVENEELLVDHVIKALFMNKKRIMVVPLDFYIHLGTPNEFKEYIFWNNKGTKLIN